MTAGKIRGLAQSSTAGGVFSIFAIDHRDSMRVVLDRDQPDSVEAERMTELKLELTAAMSDVASAILLDPEYSAVQAVERRALPGKTGMLCAIEAQGYLGNPNARETALLDGWSVMKAKKLGASGIKLLLLYRPDSSVATHQEALVRRVVEACADADIPLFLEPVMYQLDEPETPGTAQFGDDRRAVVCESVRTLGALGPDVLKVQFPHDTSGDVDRPAWEDACAELDEASPVPWTLLSGGDSYDSFAAQVEIACSAGASGFLVGRALWGHIVGLADEERRRRTDAEMRPRFTELASMAEDLGTAWFDRRPVQPQPDHDRRYAS